MSGRLRLAAGDEEVWVVEMRMRVASLLVGVAGLLVVFGGAPRAGLAESPDNLAPQPPASPVAIEQSAPSARDAAGDAIDREPTGTLPDHPATAAEPSDHGAAQPQDTLPPAEREEKTKDVSQKAAPQGFPGGAAPADPSANNNAASAIPEVVGTSLKDFIKNDIAKLQSERGKGQHASELSQERAAIAAYYSEHDYAPLWIADGKANVAAQSAVAQIGHAEDDGLDLRDFPLPGFNGGNEQLAAAEVALSEAVVAYGRQATGSRVDPHAISDLIGAKPELAVPADVLARVSAAGPAAGSVLKSFNPPQKGYEALRDKLAELRRVGMAGRITIPSGPTLRIGMRDPRVSLIRARFGLGTSSSEDADDLVYDTRVAAAVADFQKANGLPASGVLSGRTLAALSSKKAARLESEILANMERWRWMPRDMGASRIEVNIPEFMVSLVRDGKVVERHKVVVGKSATPTPIFSNKMQYLIVNPYWNVPESIVENELLPQAADDPRYLERLGYEVKWHDGRLIVRQPPSERNALGRIKFMFPNEYAVYLHDTPSRGLFGASHRAFSHGCVRVDHPFEFAEAILGPDWPMQKIKHLLGDKEHYINLPQPLPIHIEYFTAFIDDNGELQLRDDVYGYSARVKTALGLPN